MYGCSIMFICSVLMPFTRHAVEQLTKGSERSCRPTARTIHLCSCLSMRPWSFSYRPWLTSKTFSMLMLIIKTCNESSENCYFQLKWFNDCSFRQRNCWLMLMGDNVCLLHVHAPGLNKSFGLFWWYPWNNRISDCCCVRRWSWREQLKSIRP